jgi:hypothetical protein
VLTVAALRRVRRQGEKEPLSSHGTKDEAVRAGREVAEREHAELHIKNLDGRIAQADSHGYDPRNIPG